MASSFHRPLSGRADGSAEVRQSTACTEALVRILYMSERVRFSDALAQGGERPVRALARRGRTEADWLRSRRATPISPSSTSSRRRPTAAAISSCSRSSRELERRGLEVEVNRLSGGTQACLYNSFNFDFAQAEAVRARRRPHGAPGRRPDRRLPRLRRRHRPPHRRDQPGARRRDDPAVRVQPRQASRARARAARSRRDPQRGRPGDLPSAGGARAVRGPARCASSPPAGRTTRGRVPTCSQWLDRNLDSRRSRSRSPASTQARFERIRVVGAACLRAACRPAARARRLPRRRAATTLARTRCSRRLPAGCPRVSCGAAAIPSSSVTAGSASTIRGGASRKCSRGSRTSSSDVVRRSASRRSPTSPTATSKCCADDDAARSRRLALRRYVPARTSSWPDASRLFVVGDDFGWSIDDDRAR